jgi:hypothetical protein
VDTRFCLIIGILGLVSAAGCGPAAQPVWNKDSKSFFYTRTDGSVLQFDIEKRATRTILAAGDQRPRVLGINPTESLIAVPATAIGAMSRAATVNLISMPQGIHDWLEPVMSGQRESKRIMSPSAAYWSPDGHRILIWYQAQVIDMDPTGSSLGRFAVYDNRTRKVTELTTAPPAMILAQAANVSPMCPDGSGYLAMKLADNGPKFFVVTWDGWESPLEPTEEVLAELNLMVDKQLSDQERARLFFPLPHGVWAGQVLKMKTSRGEVQFDLKQRVVRLVELDATRRQLIDEIHAIDKADAPWFTVQAAEFNGDRFVVVVRQQLKDAIQLARIELLDRQEARKRVLLEGRMPESMLTHLLFPSPNRQIVLAHLLDATGKQSQIHVIQIDGQILDKVETGEVH